MINAILIALNRYAQEVLGFEAVVLQDADNYVLYLHGEADYRSPIATQVYTRIELYGLLQRYGLM